MKCVPAVTGSFAWLASCGLLAPRSRSHGGHELADAAEGWVRIVAGQGTLHAQDGDAVRERPGGCGQRIGRCVFAPAAALAGGDVMVKCLERGVARMLERRVIGAEENPGR